MTTTAIAKPTHIQRRRNAADVSMHRIVRLLSTTEHSYCNLKYNYGLKWLESYLKGDMQLVDIICRSAVFWGWWKNQWLIRDEDFLQGADGLYKLPVELRRKNYMQKHNPKALASDLHPQAAVINAGYEEMMQELMHGKKQLV